MKNLNYEDLDFYGYAHRGEEYGDYIKYYQYATYQEKTYKAIWVYTKEELDNAEEVGELEFKLEDIDRVEPVKETDNGTQH